MALLSEAGLNKIVIYSDGDSSGERLVIDQSSSFGESSEQCSLLLGPEELSIAMPSGVAAAAGEGVAAGAVGGDSTVHVPSTQGQPDPTHPARDDTPRVGSTQVTASGVTGGGGTVGGDSAVHVPCPQGQPDPAHSARDDTPRAGSTQATASDATGETGPNSTSTPIQSPPSSRKCLFNTSVTPTPQKTKTNGREVDEREEGELCGGGVFEGDGESEATKTTGVMTPGGTRSKRKARSPLPDRNYFLKEDQTPNNDHPTPSKKAKKAERRAMKIKATKANKIAKAAKQGAISSQNNRSPVPGGSRDEVGGMEVDPVGGEGVCQGGTNHGIRTDTLRPNAPAGYASVSKTSATPARGHAGEVQDSSFCSDSEDENKSFTLQTGRKKKRNDKAKKKRVQARNKFLFDAAPIDEELDKDFQCYVVCDGEEGASTNFWGQSDNKICRYLQTYIGPNFTVLGGWRNAKKKNSVKIQCHTEVQFRQLLNIEHAIVNARETGDSKPSQYILRATKVNQILHGVINGIDIDEDIHTLCDRVTALRFKENDTTFTQNPTSCSLRFLNRLPNIKKHRRTNKPVRGEDGKVISTDSRAVHFTVMAEKLPVALYLDGAVRTVTAYHFPTNHCTICLDYSHNAKSCNYKGPARCGRCGGTHETGQCEAQPSCFWCFGPGSDHPVWSAKCPIRKREFEISRVRAGTALTRHEAAVILCRQERMSQTMEDPHACTQHIEIGPPTQLHVNRPPTIKPATPKPPVMFTNGPKRRPTLTEGIRYGHAESPRVARNANRNTNNRDRSQSAARVASNVNKNKPDTVPPATPASAPSGELRSRADPDRARSKTGNPQQPHPPRALGSSEGAGQSDDWRVFIAKEIEKAVKAIVPSIIALTPPTQPLIKDIIEENKRMGDSIQKLIEELRHSKEESKKMRESISNLEKENRRQSEECQELKKQIHTYQTMGSNIPINLPWPTNALMNNCIGQTNTNTFPQFPQATLLAHGGFPQVHTLNQNAANTN